jgi:hypothetical protein
MTCHGAVALLSDYLETALGPEAMANLLLDQDGGETEITPRVGIVGPGAAPPRPPTRFVTTSRRHACAASA